VLVALVAGCGENAASKTAAKNQKVTGSDRPKSETSVAGQSTRGASEPSDAQDDAPSIQSKKLDPPSDDQATRINEEKGAIVDDAEAGGNATSVKVRLGDPELTAGIPGEGDLTIEQIKTWLDDPRNHLPLEVELPLGLSAGQSQIVGLDKNPLTRAKIELGRQLFFDKRLALTDSGIACATCHDPDHGYAKETQFGVGIRDQTGNRNSPPAYNRILSAAQFWDGRAATLEEQAKGPIANPIEMGNTHEACVTCLKGMEGYRLQFDKIFGELTIDAVAMAIASFERAIVTGPTPFDYREEFVAQFKDLEEADLEDEPELLKRYKELQQAMQDHPMSESAIRGRELFFGAKGGCTACHVGPNLSDEKYHNLGVGMDKEKPDLGRFEVTKDEKDKGAFKTPTVRNVVHTAPYMHDGSQKTLEEVVEWYDKGGHPNPLLSDKIKKLNLNEQERKDLVEFMKAVTGEFPKVAQGRLPPD
jgi:cytochrome c peroxidase